MKVSLIQNLHPWVQWEVTQYRTSERKEHNTPSMSSAHLGAARDPEQEKLLQMQSPSKGRIQYSWSSVRMRATRAHRKPHVRGRNVLCSKLTRAHEMVIRVGACHSTSIRTCMTSHLHRCTDLSSDEGAINLDHSISTGAKLVVRKGACSQGISSQLANEVRAQIACAKCTSGFHA